MKTPAEQKDWPTWNEHKIPSRAQIDAAIALWRQIPFSAQEWLIGFAKEFGYPPDARHKETYVEQRDWFACMSRNEISFYIAELAQLVPHNRLGRSSGTDAT